MFGNKLKELRVLKGYTMSELAERYNKQFNGGLNKGTISKYENSKQEPMISVVYNLASLLNVSVDCLLGNEQKEKPTTYSDEPTELEKLILDKISQLDEDGKKLALAQLDVLLTVHKGKK